MRSLTSAESWTAAWSSFWTRAASNDYLRHDKSKEKRFAFDQAFGADTDNGVLFNATAEPLVDSVLVGLNCSVFAYGATGAGKTFTMIGTPGEPGVMFRTVAGLFARSAPGQDHGVSVAGAAGPGLPRRPRRDAGLAGGSDHRTLAGRRYRDPGTVRPAGHGVAATGQPTKDHRANGDERDLLAVSCSVSGEGGASRSQEPGRRRDSWQTWPGRREPPRRTTAAFGYWREPTLIARIGTWKLHKCFGLRLWLRPIPRFEVDQATEGFFRWKLPDDDDRQHLTEPSEL